jgi:hypothetical protein
MLSVGAAASGCIGMLGSISLRTNGKGPSGSQAWYCPGLSGGLMVLASFTTCIAASYQETRSYETRGSYSVCSGRWRR